jgi:hypothetical protein
MQQHSKDLWRMNDLLKLATVYSDFPPVTFVESKTSADILNAIKSRAVKTWGEDDWFKEIVKEYVRLENEQAEEDGKKANYINRRNQIERAFTAGSCRLDTAMLLAKAVNCRFQMVCTEVSKF